MREIKRAFLDFMDRVPFYGMLVVCNDDPAIAATVSANSAPNRYLWNPAGLRFPYQAA